MKKLIALILALILPAAALAELTDSENEYVGVWTMYASHGSAIYNYSLTFTEDGYVFFHTMRIIGGEVYNDATTSGMWYERASTIRFTVAGTNIIADINKDGYLSTFRADDMVGVGTYFRCPDMGYTISWE